MRNKISAFIFLLMSFVLCGCINSEINDTKEDKITFSSFNDQSYVWESFVFPTNRVMDRK